MEDRWEPIRQAFPFSLSLVAEEMGDDFERALKGACSMGISELEFGSLWGDRIDTVPFERMVIAREMLDRAGLSVRILSTGAFKPVNLEAVDREHIHTDPNVIEHLRLLNTTIEAAGFFGAPLVRIFTFRRDTIPALGNPSPREPDGGDFPDEILDKIAIALEPALQFAERKGVALAVENVRSCWCNSGKNTARLLERVQSPWLKVIWDPANAYVSGETKVVETGYRLVKPSIAHIHLKDAVVVDNQTGLIEWEKIGAGECDIATQLRALRDDGYDGCLSIETHWNPAGSDREENTYQTYLGLIGLLEQI